MRSHFVLNGIKEFKKTHQENWYVLGTRQIHLVCVWYLGKKYRFGIPTVYESHSDFMMTRISVSVLLFKKSGT